MEEYKVVHRAGTRVRFRDEHQINDETIREKRDHVNKVLTTTRSRFSVSSAHSRNQKGDVRWRLTGDGAPPSIEEISQLGRDLGPGFYGEIQSTSSYETTCPVVVVYSPSRALLEEKELVASGWWPWVRSMPTSVMSTVVFASLLWGHTRQYDDAFLAILPQFT